MALLNDPNRRMAALVSTASANFPETDLRRLDRRRLDDWVEQLRDAEAAIHQLRVRVEGLQLLEYGRHCLRCGSIFAGGRNQRYCTGCASVLPRTG